VDVHVEPSVFDRQKLSGNVVLTERHAPDRTSVLLRLLVDDEVVGDAAQRLRLDSDFVLGAEIGYAEARAALASARRGGRLDARGLSTATAELNALWAQVDVVPVTAELDVAAPSNPARAPERMQLGHAAGSCSCVLHNTERRRHCGRIPMDSATVSARFSFGMLSPMALEGVRAHVDGDSSLPASEGWGHTAT
jgi:hypothetical protein